MGFVMCGVCISGFCNGWECECVCFVFFNVRDCVCFAYCNVCFGTSFRFVTCGCMCFGFFNVRFKCLRDL